LRQLALKKHPPFTIANPRRSIYTFLARHFAFFPLLVSSLLQNSRFSERLRAILDTPSLPEKRLIAVEKFAKVDCVIFIPAWIS